MSRISLGHAAFACTICLALTSLPAMAQITLRVTPGLTIPNDDMPWALDTFDGREELVPIHRSTSNINEHTGANIAGSLAGSFFYKPKITSELPGLHARTVLHSTRPSFYLRVTPDPADDSNPGAAASITGWAISGALPGKNKRVFQEVRITQLTNKGKREDGAVASQVEPLPGGWFKLSPAAPLEPGEYALVPLFKSQRYLATLLFDFSINPQAPNATDAVEEHR